MANTQIQPTEKTLEWWKQMLKTLAIIHDGQQRDKAAKSKRGYYNPYALFHIFEGINEALAEEDFLKDPKKALARHFIIRGETGGINHRNIPADLSTQKFTLPFLNDKRLWKPL